MFRLIPPRVHRGLYRAAWQVRTAWWRLAKPQVRGTRVIVLDGEGSVLLIRQSYGSRTWAAPGGGMGSRDADVIACAARELFEETGLGLEKARHVETRYEQLHGATNVVEVVVGIGVGEPRPDGREVEEIGWFSLAALPDDISPRVLIGLHHWIAAWRDQSRDN